MSATLRIGPNLELPLDAVTQTFGILGKRGVGKTSAAVVLAEELLERQLQVVALDPVGVWHGLRSSADGKGPGYPILVLGGDHGDLPLEASSGRLVADFVVGKGASAVLDLGAMSKGDQARFVGEFLERVYQKNRAPLHLVIDEADAFAPQRLHPNMNRCFGAVDQVVRRGRARGLGVTLVTQRSAAINKDVLSQIEVLVAFRTIAPQDRAALEAWVDQHGDEATWKAMLASLSTLEVGESWWWSPAWLERFERVRVRRRRTFDSSATPKVGQVARTPRRVADVDVEAFRAELAELVQKADQEDPRRLRARIAELERAAASRPAAPAPKVERVEISVIRPVDVRRLERTAIAAEALSRDVRALLARFPTRADQPRRPVHPPAPASAAGREPVAPRRVSPASPASGNGQDTKLAGGERKILTALAHYPQGRTKVQVALLTGYAHSGGGFNNYLSSLRARDLVLGADPLRITQAGLDALGPYDPLPTGPELLEYWRGQLGKAECLVLDALAAAWPNAMSKEEVAARAGYEASGGGFNNALSRLRTFELIEGRGELRASEVLFS